MQCHAFCWHPVLLLTGPCIFGQLAASVFSSQHPNTPRLACRDVQGSMAKALTSAVCFACCVALPAASVPVDDLGGSDDDEEGPQGDEEGPHSEEAGSHSGAEGSEGTELDASELLGSQDSDSEGLHEDGQARGGRGREDDEEPGPGPAGEWLSGAAGWKLLSAWSTGTSIGGACRAKEVEEGLCFLWATAKSGGGELGKEEHGADCSPDLWGRGNFGAKGALPFLLHGLRLLEVSWRRLGRSLAAGSAPACTNTKGCIGATGCWEVALELQCPTVATTAALYVFG